MAVSVAVFYSPLANLLFILILKLPLLLILIAVNENSAGTPFNRIFIAFLDKKGKETEFCNLR